MKSVRRACALLAIAAVIVLVYPAGAPFGDGQHGQKRLAPSMSRPAPSTVEAWERERTAFVERMKAGDTFEYIELITLDGYPAVMESTWVLLQNPDGQMEVVQTSGPSSATRALLGESLAESHETGETAPPLNADPARAE